MSFEVMSSSLPFEKNINYLWGFFAQSTTFVILQPVMAEQITLIWAYLPQFRLCHSWWCVTNIDVLDMEEPI